MMFSSWILRCLAAGRALDRPCPGTIKVKKTMDSTGRWSIYVGQRICLCAGAHKRVCQTRTSASTPASLSETDECKCPENRVANVSGLPRPLRRRAPFPQLAHPPARPDRALAPTKCESLHRQPLDGPAVHLRVTSSVQLAGQAPDYQRVVNAKKPSEWRRPRGHACPHRAITTEPAGFTVGVPLDRICGSRTAGWGIGFDGCCGSGAGGFLLRLNGLILSRKLRGFGGTMFEGATIGR